MGGVTNCCLTDKQVASQGPLPEPGDQRQVVLLISTPKPKPRWNVHLSGADDQLGYAGESLSSVLGE